jgi:hypothetical protein
MFNGIKCSDDAQTIVQSFLNHGFTASDIARKVDVHEYTLNRIATFGTQYLSDPDVERKLREFVKDTCSTISDCRHCHSN